MLPRSGALGSEKSLMKHRIQIEYKERERDALKKLAREIVEIAEQRDRALSPGEDGMVLELLRKASVLEQELAHLSSVQQHQPPESGDGSEARAMSIRPLEFAFYHEMLTLSANSIHTWKIAGSRRKAKPDALA